MKKVFVLLIMVMVINISFGQKIKEFYFGIRVKDKSDISKMLIRNPYIPSRPIIDDGRYIVPYFGVLLNDKWALEIDYLRHEFFNTGYILHYPRTDYGGSSHSVDYADALTLYTRYKIGIYKDRINLFPKAGITYLYSRYGRSRTFDGDENWAQQNDDGSWFIEKIHFEWQKDYGFHKTYFFLNGGIDLEYRAFDFLHFSISVAYMHGFKTMGYNRGWYQITGEPKMELLGSTKGSNVHVAIGAQFHFKPVKIDTKKVFRKRKYEMDVGISSVFEWTALKNYVSDFNLYFGPSFSIGTERLSTVLSVLHTSRDIKYDINKYSLTDEDYANNTKTKLTANVSDKVIRLQQSFRYRFKKIRNSEFSIGLGYLFQKPYNVSGERKTVTGSGIENVKEINSGIWVFGLLGELNYTLKMNSRLRLTSSVSYQKFQGKNNYFRYPLNGLDIIYDREFKFNHWDNLYMYYSIGMMYRIVK